MGLNDNYNVVRENILMMNPLPSISQIYSMLIQEEKQSEVKATAHFLADSESLSGDAHIGYQAGNQGFRKQFDRNEG